MGRMLLVLVKEYARWERCCVFYSKGKQDGKEVACFARRVRKMRKALHVSMKKYATCERCCIAHREDVIYSIDSQNKTKLVDYNKIRVGFMLYLK
ncbi:hypothetical protein FC683_17650 [Bacillus cereus]|nr:hypothetical protein FC683_17650 [Bacillus cereus]